MALYGSKKTAGITGNILDPLGNIYASPKFRILILGALSGSIPLERGTRQGGALSPFLFNLAIEPLARYLNSSPKLAGVRCRRDEEIPIALFADDILQLTASLASDIPYILGLWIVPDISLRVRFSC